MKFMLRRQTKHAQHSTSQQSKTMGNLLSLIRGIANYSIRWNALRTPRWSMLSSAHAGTQISMYIDACCRLCKAMTSSANISHLSPHVLWIAWGRLQASNMGRDVQLKEHWKHICCYQLKLPVIGSNRSPTGANSAFHRTLVTFHLETQP